MSSTYLFSLYVMMCINFPITVRLLQNNERGFPLIFTITVAENNIIDKACDRGVYWKLSSLEFHLRLGQQ
jgi:hypothetical protein